MVRIKFIKINIEKITKQGKTNVNVNYLSGLVDDELRLSANMCFSNEESGLKWSSN